MKRIIVMLLRKKIRSVINFVAFFLVFIIIFSKITWLFRGNGIESREDVCGLRNQEEEIDVLLYGASTLLRFYQPLEAWKLHGYTSYNYATSSGTIELYRAFIDDSRQTQKAKLYVCDIRTLIDLDMDVSETALRNWSDSLPVFSTVRWKGITQYFANKGLDGIEIPSYYLDIIKYHSNYDSLKSEYQWKYLNLRSIHNVDKGFYPNISHIPVDRPKESDVIGELTELQRNVLDDLLDYCDKNNLKMLFICCPIITVEKHWACLNAAAEVIEGRGYDFINFNKYYDEMMLDFETDFGDINHVNMLGAEKYTTYLMDYICKNYDLPDHRGDERYSHWEEDYIVFEESRKEWKMYIDEIVVSHKASHEKGKVLPFIEDFREWSECIFDPNYSVIILSENAIDYSGDDRDFEDFLNRYDLNNGHGNCMIWVGESCIANANDAGLLEANIGVDGGRGTDACTASVSSENTYLKINDKDFYTGDSKIQIVVYDNIYREILDNVSIDWDAQNIICMR